MTNLSFDVEAAKAQLTQLLQARIRAQGATYDLFNVDLGDLDLGDLEIKVDDQAQLIAELQGELATAQAQGRSWLGDVMPRLTTAAQAVIDYAARWDSAMPLILAQLRLEAPDRTVLAELFGGLQSSANQQLAAISPVVSGVRALRDEIALSAANFTRNHLPFRQLEDLDLANLAAARSTIAEIGAALAAYSEEIDLDMITAQRDLAIASNAMKYGGKLGDPGKVVGLTIGLVFIVSATMAIDDLLAAVDARLAEAQREAGYELEMTLLTVQLVGLEVASTALAGLGNQLAGMVDALDATVAGWGNEAANLAAVVDGLGSAAPLEEVVNQFDLGRAQAEWSELAGIATKWQTMEIAARPSNELVLDPSPGS